MQGKLFSTEPTYILGEELPNSNRKSKASLFNTYIWPHDYQAINRTMHPSEE